MDQPRLLVFRGPLPDGLADALEQCLGPHERWGPPASVGARTPPGGTRFRVGGSTWVVHLERGLLLARRVTTTVVPRVPSTG